MEDKQLNINQPLLSVRRFSSITASPKNESRRTKSYLPTMRSVESCKTELNSDPTTNMGNVPFVWEQSPGRPKDETNKRIQTKETPPCLPKLPPGWILKPKKKDSEDLSTEFQSAISGKKESSDSENDYNDDDDDDDDTDEAFMDALDTLSRAESSFYNCSASGVSGLGSHVKPSGILSADPKVRDFMMGRFLPAAKAMASEVPQNGSRKHVVKEKPREVKRMITNVDSSKKVQLRYGPNFLQDMIRDNEEDSDYEYDEHGNISSKLCGFLPRFCLKGSVGHVNPVSGTRTANRTHAIASSSSISSFSETENEPARIGIYEHRSFDKSSVLETSSQNIYNRLQGRAISNEGSQSLVPERTNPSSQKKRATSFKELLANDNNKNEKNSQDFLIEKTLYVDTVHIVKSPKGQSRFRTDDTNMMVADDDETRDHIQMETRMDQDHGEWIDDKNGDQDLKSDQDGVFELPAPPPLPKSPSDSWLWRTLPAVSSKNANTAIRLSPKYPNSNVQIGHSEGSLLPIPES